MPHQYLNHVINQSTKRRMYDDDDDEEDQAITFTKHDQGPKRLNDLTQEFNPNNAPPKPEIPLPSLTYASPDYRPPPRPDALWLQPVQPPPPSSTMPSTPAATQPMMEEDSTDEDDILPPNATNAFFHHHPSSTPNATSTKQTTGIDWIMTDQC